MSASKLSCLITFLAFGCSGDDAARSTLRLQLEHRVGNQRLEVGEPALAGDGVRIRFDQIRYWISNVVLLGPAGAALVPDGYFLVEKTPERTRTTIELPGIPAGEYDRITFGLGVDPARNHHLDQLTGELEPGIDMDWTWFTGFIFFKAEGTFQKLDREGTFVFHIGTDELYQIVRKELLPPLVLEEGREATLVLEVATERLFSGLALDGEVEIRGGPADSPSGRIARNYVTMFRTKAEAEQFDISTPNPFEDPSDPAPPGRPIPKDATPPSLTHAILDRELVCTSPADRPPEEERACFSPFSADDLGRLTFVTAASAEVSAAAPGIVDDVRFSHHSELSHMDHFEVVVRPNADSAFFLEYGNLKEVTPNVGDRVEAGQLLGKAGDHFDLEFGLTTFAVRRQQAFLQRLCPAPFATGEVLADWNARREASNAAWPSFTHPALCESFSLLCADDRCNGARSFVAAQGDVEEGRLIYESTCASCHGRKGEGDIGPSLCANGCDCPSCIEGHGALATRIQVDMPPEGYCDERCARDVAAFILHALGE